MSVKKFFFLFLIFSLQSIQDSRAQTFTASVNSTKVSSEEQFEISFVFSGSDVNSISNFQPPKFNDFVILSGPNQSTSMQIINGVVSGSRSFSYYIQARSTGKFVIPSASIVHKNETLRTEPITIEVVKGTPKPKQQQNDQGVSNEEIAENLFIRASVDKSTVYKGEQLTVVYKLYTRLNIASPQISKLPSYEGFWAEELETSNNISFSRETIDGKVYNVGVLKRAALFPTQTGDLSVTPFELKIPVQVQSRRRSNSIFDDFFNDPFFGRAQTVEYTAKSNTVKVKVNPLPNSNEVSFKGAVGNYSLTASVDKEKIKQNEPISVKVKISGSGNLKLVDQPEIIFPNGFEVYDPKVTDEISRSGIVSGSKNFEFLAIPRNSGKYEIQPIEFTFFNPSKKGFTTLTSQTFVIEVEQGVGEYAGSNAIVQQDIKLLDKDIRYIKTGLTQKNNQEIWIFSYSFLIAIIIPLLIAGTLLIWKRKEDNLASNITLLKNIKAQKVASKRLKKAAKLLKVKNADLFYEEIAFALSGYIQDKFNIEKSDYSIDKAVSKLTMHDTSDELISSLKSTIEKCDFIRYAPAVDQQSDMQNMYDSTVKLIYGIEDSSDKRGKNV